MSLSLAERNKNLLNLKHNPKVRWPKVRWLGLHEPPSDGTFCRFRTDEDGIRAAARNALTLQARGLVTVVRLLLGDKGRPGQPGDIAGWAPPTENYTEVYIATVAEHMGVSPDLVFDLRDRRYSVPLFERMIQVETGKRGACDRATLERGLAAAGI